MAKFRQKYRNVDILLIDDIQFIESKKKTMEELFNTFDALYNKNKQIVITSDRLPKDIPTLPARLRTRFEMGLVVDITPPELEVRIEILKNLAKTAGLEPEPDVYQYIAKYFDKNVRELEGAFNKVSAYADIEQTALTLQFAKKVLKCEDAAPKLNLNSVAEYVSGFCNIDLRDLQGVSRNKNVANARNIAVYLAREALGLSYMQIAEFLGKKHPTILYSYEQTCKKLEANIEFKALIEKIRTGLGI